MLWCPDSHLMPEGTIFLPFCMGCVFYLEFPLCCPFYTMNLSLGNDTLGDGLSHQWVERVSTYPHPWMEFSPCLSHSSFNSLNSLMTSVTLEVTENILLSKHCSAGNNYFHVSLLAALCCSSVPLRSLDSPPPATGLGIPPTQVHSIPHTHTLSTLYWAVGTL